MTNLLYLQSSYFFPSELIVTRASDSILTDFSLSVMVFELNLIAMKLMKEEALVYLLCPYHTAPDIALYFIL
jgi:hypothetical protein